MQTTLALREKASQLLAADTATLAPAVLNNKLALFINAATPSETMVLADFTLADFDGSTPLDVGTGTQAEGLDPNNSDSLITLKEPVGGFRWETTGVTNLPQTVYGFVLLDNALAVVYAAKRFTTPITLTAINQVIHVQDAIIRQLANSMV